MLRRQRVQMRRRTHSYLIVNDWTLTEIGALRKEIDEVIGVDTEASTRLRG